MSEFFIELFSEEIPANLQNKTRQDFFQNLKEFLDKEDIKYSGEATAFSIPNRLIVYFQNISKKITKKENEIRGPNICLLYTSPSPRDISRSRMPSSA